MRKSTGLLCVLSLAGIVPLCLAAENAAPAAAKPPAAEAAPAPAEKPAALKTEKETRSYAVGMYYGKFLKHAEPNLDLAAAVQGMKDAMVGDKNSYAAGMTVGREITRTEVDVEAETLLRGIKDAAAGASTLLSDEEYQKVMTELRRDLDQKLIEKNKKKGEDFLAENAKKEGVTTLPSGLQYKVLKEGEGKIPAAADSVSVNYRGTFVDGTPFDDSYKTGKPVTFQVGVVIPGWGEALQKMKVGSKWQIFIPANLAYGERGRPPVILPNSVLIFELELLSIEPPGTGMQLPQGHPSLK